MTCSHMIGIRSKKVLPIKISPKFLCRIDALKLCFGFHTSHVYRHSMRNLRNIGEHDSNLMQRVVYASGLITLLLQFANYGHRDYRTFSSRQS